MPRCPNDHKSPDIIWNLNKLAQMPRSPEAQMPRRPETQMPRAKFPDEYKYPKIIWNFNKLAQMPRSPDSQTITNHLILFEI